MNRVAFSVKISGSSHLNHETHETHEQCCSGIIWRAVTPFHWMMIFVSIRVHSWFNPFVPIRVHSWFCAFFSCISCGSWFNPFAPIRGSIHSCTFVSIRGSGFSFRVFRVHSWFKPFAPIRGSSTCFRKKIKKTSRLRCFFEIICRLNHRGVVILGFSLHELPGTM